VAKQPIVTYQWDVFSSSVAVRHILISINIYLPPQSYHKRSVGQHYIDQPNSEKTPSERIGKIPKNTEAL
jgi:hypothetical protein